MSRRGPGYLPGPRPGHERAGARAVSGRCARAGRSMWLPGTAATAEGHGEEGASHGGAPRPRPRPSVTTRAGPRRPGRRRGTGGERAAPPSLPLGGPGWGVPGRRARSPAPHPGPRLGRNRRRCPQRSVRSRLRGPRAAAPPSEPDPRSHPLPPVLRALHSAGRVARRSRSRVGKAFSHPGSTARGGRGRPGVAAPPGVPLSRGHGKRFSAQRGDRPGPPTGPSAPERCSGLDPGCWAGREPPRPQKPHPTVGGGQPRRTDSDLFCLVTGSQGRAKVPFPFGGTETEQPRALGRRPHAGRGREKVTAERPLGSAAPPRLGIASAAEARLWGEQGRCKVGARPQHSGSGGGPRLCRGLSRHWSLVGGGHPCWLPLHQLSPPGAPSRQG